MNHPHIYEGNDMGKALAADQAKLDAMMEPAKPVDPINAQRDELNMTEAERSLCTELLVFSVLLQIRSMSCRTPEETEKALNDLTLKTERRFVEKLRAYKAVTPTPVLN